MGSIIADICSITMLDSIVFALFATACLNSSILQLIITKMVLTLIKWSFAMISEQLSADWHSYTRNFFSFFSVKVIWKVLLFNFFTSSIKFIDLVFLFTLNSFLGISAPKKELFFLVSPKSPPLWLLQL